MRSLIYLYDPLCGWCYAAAPVIEYVHAAGVTVRMLPTGLFSDPSRLMTADFAEYAWENDRRIAVMTGQPFTETYRKQVLQRPGTAFDSSTATLGLTAVAIEQPHREAEALQAVQQARYVGGRDITDQTTISAVLTEAGFSGAAAALVSPSPALLEANAARVAEGAAMVRDLGGRGVPTIAVVDGPTRRLIDSQLLYGPPEAMLALVAPAAA